MKSESVKPAKSVDSIKETLMENYYMFESETIQLAHGNGGALTGHLIRTVFLKKFENQYLYELGDSAILPLDKSALELPNNAQIAFTTDSFVVNPIFFPGGDIGKLAVCGTLNDLAMIGAKPKFLSCGFIIEEGFEIKSLERIVESMQDASKEAEVLFVAGDTKVVEKGSAHKIFINTSGIGFFDNLNQPIKSTIEQGDEILINGTMGDHGIAVLSARDNFGLETTIESDCASLYPLVQALRQNGVEIKFLRDATRGGVATVLNEVAKKFNIGVLIYENLLPISSEVREVCEILGFDPLYIANEGKMIIIVKMGMGDKALEVLRKHPLGKNASKIGSIVDDHPQKVVLETFIKGKRLVDLLVSDQFPRIC